MAMRDSISLSVKTRVFTLAESPSSITSNLTTTPGTTQACSFRDAHATFTAPGLTIFGLSADSPKANTTFKTKQALPYTLLCDPQGVLLRPLGLFKPPKSAKRGVVVLDAGGKVLAAELGGPAATVEAVRRVVDGLGKGA